MWRTKRGVVTALELEAAWHEPDGMETGPYAAAQEGVEMEDVREPR